MESFTIQIDLKKYKIVTTGNEAIHAAIRRWLKFPKKNIDKMFVQQEGAHVNVGLPSGVLVEENGVYDCTFKKNMLHTVCDEENIRLYDYESFTKDWVIEYRFFYISFKEKRVSKFHGYFQKEKVRVDFFVGEGLYQALYRDGRFLRDSLRSCEIFCKEEAVEVSLRELADNYHCKHLIVKRLSPEPDPDLPSSVPPQLFPLSHTFDANAQENKGLSAPSSDSHAAVKKAVKVEAEETSPNTSWVREVAQSIPRGAAMTSSSASKVVWIVKNDDDLAAFVSKKLGLDVKSKKSKREEKKRLAAIAEFTGKFSLQPYHRTYTKDMMLLMQMRESVGAICATVGEGTTLHGTCFRVGKIYVLTCCHVVDGLKKATRSLTKDAFITFNFEEQPLESPNILKYSLAPGKNPVFDDKELDFAMLEMDSRQQLPKPVTEYGFELDTTGLQLPEGEGLRLIGHPGPGNEPKQIDTFCPIDHNDLAKWQSLYITHGITYHVTSFRHSSSGSPGVSVERKKLIAIHSRGIPLNSMGPEYSIEQGTMLSSVIEFVKKKCVATNRDIAEYFGKLPEHEPMELCWISAQWDVRLEQGDQDFWPFHSYLAYAVYQHWFSPYIISIKVSWLVLRNWKLIFHSKLS